MNQSICKHWSSILFLGITFLILGTAAVLLPFVSTISVVFAAGVILIISGILEVMQALNEKLARRKVLHFLLAAISIFLGIVFIFQPSLSALMITLLLAAFLIMSGIFKIIISLAIEQKYWVWLLINGLISLLLGVLIYLQWPVSGLWVIGLFIGIDLIFNGWALIMLALAVKKECQSHK
jgi:uncharacterized membrane protein HdeD (DUF308 family)